MKNSRLFSDDKIGYDEYLKNIQEALSSTKVFSCKTNIASGINSVVKLDDPIRRQKMIDVSMLVDRELKKPNSNANNAGKKIPVIMTLANIIANHYEQVNDLSIEQLALLGYFSYVVDESTMDEHLNVFGSGDLLGAVMEKTSVMEDRIDILRVVEGKYFENNIDKDNKLELNNFKNEMITMINTNSTECLVGMAKSVDELVQELEKDGYSF